MPKRKHHHKSRTGCDDCKRRRKKCDEEKPACRRCINTGIVCSGYNAPKAWVFALSQSPDPDSEHYTDQSITNAIIRRSSNSPASSISPYSVHYLKSGYTGRERDRVVSSAAFSVYGPNFVWRLHKDDREQVEFAQKFIYFCLHEPCLLEAIFMGAQGQMSREIGSSEQGAQYVIRHLCRSMNLLRERLATVSAAHEDAIFWTVVAHLVNNQEQNDFNGFQINLQGLRKIVELWGGRETLVTRCPRLPKFYDWAILRYAAFEGSRDAQRSHVGHSCRAEDKEFTDEDFPEHFKRLSLYSGLASTVANFSFSSSSYRLICRTTSWFHDHTTSSNHNADESNGPTVRYCLSEQLNEKLRNPELPAHERITCTALFVLVVTSPPAYMSERYPVTIASHVTSVWTNCKDLMAEDCFLWCSILVASVPVVFGLSVAERWSLLEGAVRCRSAENDRQTVDKLRQDYPMPVAIKRQWVKLYSIAKTRTKVQLSAIH